MVTPGVSILMPVYNDERYVCKAIESILNQTFTDFKFIIIDDGSTDNTPRILSEYARCDPRIKLIRNKDNRGIVYSLNRGLSLTRSEYIARMDANDISLPERLAKQVAYLDQHPEVGVLGTNIAYIDTRGNLLNNGRPKDRHELSPNFIRWMLMWRCPIYHPTVMIRRSILKQTGFGYDPTFRHVEDRDLWTRLAEHTIIASLPEVLVYYRIDPISICRIHRKEQQSKDVAISRREIIKLLGYNPDEEILNTLLRVFSGDSVVSVASDSDFSRVGDLLLQIYRCFVQRPLHLRDRRQIDRDVARRLLILGRKAALFSPWSALKVAWKMRNLSPEVIFTFETVRGIAGVFLRMVGLRRHFISE